VAEAGSDRRGKLRRNLEPIPDIEHQQMARKRPKAKAAAHELVNAGRGQNLLRNEEIGEAAMQNSDGGLFE
jgi:hypothetical protein